MHLYMGPPIGQYVQIVTEMQPGPIFMYYYSD